MLQHPDGVDLFVTVHHVLSFDCIMLSLFFWQTDHRQGSDVCDNILNGPGATDGHHHLLLLIVCGHIVGRLMLPPSRCHLGKVEMIPCTDSQIF